MRYGGREDLKIKRTLDSEIQPTLQIMGDSDIRVVKYKEEKGVL